MYTTIVATENNRITKFAEFEDEQTALDHSSVFGGFVYAGDYSPDLYVDGETVTLKPDEETPEQVIARLESALDRHLDAVANSYRYTDIARMAGYAGDPDPQFDREGTAAKNWRSAVYRQGINKIIACTREVDPDPIPTEEELIASMPIFETFLQP